MIEMHYKKKKNRPPLSASGRPEAALMPGHYVGLLVSAQTLSDVIGFLTLLIWISATSTLLTTN